MRAPPSACPTSAALGTALVARSVARHGVPRHIDALGGHCMVGFRSSATGAVLLLEFTSGGTMHAVMLPSTVTVSGAETYASTARAGLGLIQAPRYRLEQDFRRAALVPVLTATPPTRTPVSALHPRAKHLFPRLRVLLDWLSGQFRRQGTAT